MARTDRGMDRRTYRYTNKETERWRQTATDRETDVKRKIQKDSN